MSKVYPEPADAKLAKMKRRWYKIYVDMEFDPEYQTPKEKSTTRIQERVKAPDGLP